jgi:hypothetical protein
MNREEARSNNLDPPERRSRTGDDSGVMALRRLSEPVRLTIPGHRDHPSNPKEGILQFSPHNNSKWRKP